MNKFGCNTCDATFDNPDSHDCKQEQLNKLQAQVEEMEKTVDQEINARLDALGQVDRLKGYLEWCAFHVNLPSRKTYDMIYEEGLRTKAEGGKHE